MADPLKLPPDLADAGWTLHAFEALRATAPAADPVTAFALAVKLAQVRAADGEDAARITQRGFEAMLRGEED